MSSISKVFLAALLLISCTTTITKTKPVNIAATAEILTDTLQKLVACEHINLEGKEITTNGKSQSVLEIDIINGKQVPEGDALRALGKSIASTVKATLANKSDFDNFKVLFVKQQKSNAVSTRSWTGYEYQSADL